MGIPAGVLDLQGSRVATASTSDKVLGCWGRFPGQRDLALSEGHTNNQPMPVGDLVGLGSRFLAHANYKNRFV